MVFQRGDLEKFTEQEDEHLRSLAKVLHEIAALVEIRDMTVIYAEWEMPVMGDDSNKEFHSFKLRIDFVPGSEACKKYFSERIVR